MIRKHVMIANVSSILCMACNSESSVKKQMTLLALGLGSRYSRPDCVYAFCVYRAHFSLFFSLRYVLVLCMLRASRMSEWNWSLLTTAYGADGYSGKERGKANMMQDVSI